MPPTHSPVSGALRNHRTRSLGTSSLATTKNRPYLILTRLEASKGLCAGCHGSCNSWRAISVATMDSGSGSSSPGPRGLCLAVALILLNMPRTVRVGSADKLPQVLHTSPKSHSCHQCHDRQAHTESGFAIRRGLLQGFLSSLLLCFLSTGYSNHAAREMWVITPCGSAPISWLFSARPGHSGSTDKMGEVTCESSKAGVSE